MPESRPTTTSDSAAQNWMAEFGIKKGEYLSVTKSQLKTQQRPDKPLKVQVWATGILHTAGYQGEVAYTMRKGKKVLLTPNDIINELHQVAIKFFRDGGIEPSDEELAKLRETKETLRRVLSDLEEDGVAQRTDLKGTPLSKLTSADLKRLPSGKTRLLFWLKPTRATEKRISQEWLERKAIPTPREVDTNLTPLPSARKILNMFQVNQEWKSQLSEAQFRTRVIHAYEAARTIFLREIEVDIACLPTQVDAPGLPEVDTPGGAFEIKDERNEIPIPPMQAAGRAQTPEPETDGLPPASLSQELARRKLSVGMKMLTKIVATLNECPVFYFLEVLDRRAERGAIGTGLLTHVAEDAAREFQAQCNAVDEVA